MKRLMSLAAFSAALMCGTAQAQQVTVKIGVMSDMSSLYADIGGPGSTAAAQAGDRGLRQGQSEREGRAAQRRPSEQGRTSAPASSNQWFDVEKVDVVIDVPNSRRRARGQRDRAEQEQGVHRLGRRGVRPHRRQVQRQHRALDLRHLDAGQRHRQRAGEDRRRHLVLPHRRLRLRSRARARHRGGGRKPTAARWSARCATRSTPTTSRRSCCRRRRPRPRSSASPTPAATPSTRSSRRRVRHRQGRPEVRRPAGVRHRRQRARAQHRAGPDPDRELVLGPQRRQPRLDQALAGRARRGGQVPDHGAGRRLCRRDALPQGGRRR